jgi:L-alanine-DL-glutamate epimerase-like enolase superfamily enzyme
MKLTRKQFLRSIGGAAATAGLGSLVPRGLAAAAATGPSLRKPKVVSVEVFPLNMTLKQVMKIALATPFTADNVLVRLRTDDGLIGYGESSPYSAVMGETQASDFVLAKPLAAMVKGRDPFTLPQIVEAMTGFSPTSPGITAAFEMALWDICGKAAGQPVYRLLGAARDSFETDQTVYLDPPEVMSAKALAIARRGFKNIKVKLGETPESDIARVKAIREAVGPGVSLRTDANQAWTVANAIRTLRGLEPYRVQFCEQPVPYWDWAGLKQIRNNSPVPVMADESVHSPHDALTGIREDAMDMINMKLMKTGGILQAVRLAHIAAAANMPCMLGCMNETKVALTAAAHVVMSQEIIRYADLDAFLEHETDPVMGGMQVKAGVVTLPEAPGLGLDIDPAFLKKLQPLVL